MDRSPAIFNGRKQRRHNESDESEDEDRRRKSSIAFSEVQSSGRFPRVIRRAIRPGNKKTEAISHVAATFDWASPPPPGYGFVQGSSVAHVPSSTLQAPPESSLVPSKAYRQPGTAGSVGEEERSRRSSLSLSKEQSSSRAPRRMVEIVLCKIVRTVVKSEPNSPVAAINAAPAPFNLGVSPPAGRGIGQGSSAPPARCSLVEISSESPVGERTPSASMAFRQPGNVDRHAEDEQEERSRKSSLSLSLQEVQSSEGVPRVTRRAVRPLLSTEAISVAAAISAPPATFNWGAPPPPGFGFVQGSCAPPVRCCSVVEASSKSSAGDLTGASKACRQPGNVQRHAEDEEAERSRKSSLSLPKNVELEGESHTRTVRQVRRGATVAAVAAGAAGGPAPLTFRFGSSQSQAGPGGVFRFQSCDAPSPRSPLGAASGGPQWAGCGVGAQEGSATVEPLLSKEEETDPLPDASPAHWRNVNRCPAGREERERKTTITFQDGCSTLPRQIRRAIHQSSQQPK